MNTGRMASAMSGWNASSPPKAGATPRPPPKPRNGERLWPMMTARPARTSTSTPAPRARARSTATVPLTMSSSPARSARRGPMARIVLAPPVRPLPIVRGSVPPLTLATMTPNGMPPIR